MKNLLKKKTQKSSIDENIYIGLFLCSLSFAEKNPKERNKPRLSHFSIDHDCIFLLFVSCFFSLLRWNDRRPIATGDEESKRSNGEIGWSWCYIVEVSREKRSNSEKISPRVVSWHGQFSPWFKYSSGFWCKVPARSTKMTTFGQWNRKPFHDIMRM